MALKSLTVKVEEAELDKIEREAKAVPRRTTSEYVRQILAKRRKPAREPMHSDD